ncbi:MAG: sensor histidine kinase [Mongoliitalea sp.]
MFKKITQFFIPKKKLETEDNLRSETIFVSVLLISGLSNLLGVNLAYEIDSEVNAYLLLINAFINLLILFAYRYGLPKPIAATVFLTQFAVTFPIQAWLQGGLSSPAAAALFLLPAVAMLISGKNAAIFWMIVSAILSLGLFIMESNLGAPVPQYDLSKKQLFYFSSILGTNFTIFLILLIYELGKSKALKNIQEKNDILISAQEQLIQQEKLASLGQLTAGIAHEIKNPLNFVNNFSEIGTELLEEVFEELDKLEDSTTKKEIVAILQDVKVNLSKIHEHGTRANGIVSSMLMHSRGGSGKMEPTDLNAHVKEYINLAFHGMRAGKNPINVDIQYDLDENIGSINLIEEDFSRVILNLCNNAFDAMRERVLKTQSKRPAYQSDNQKIQDRSSSTMQFIPKLKVTTTLVKGQVRISFEDNGIGIPEAIKDKILQPFFTTKKGTEGTGLGLSISHDIVKRHSGILHVESEVGVGTKFTISLSKN